MSGMPRAPRFCPPGFPVHVVQRGNNRQICFTSDDDLAAYAYWLNQAAHRYGVQIHAWVFMTNHVHLLMTPPDARAISGLMQYIGRQYVQSFNFKYARTGTLFEGRFKSSLVQTDEYLLNCMRYIELNPVRAGIAADPGDYLWSSYRCHAFGKNASLWTPHSDYLALGQSSTERQQAYRELISQIIPTELVQKIRHCLNTGLVLGTENFRNQVSALRE